MSETNLVGERLSMASAADDRPQAAESPPPPRRWRQRASARVLLGGGAVLIATAAFAMIVFMQTVVAQQILKDPTKIVASYLLFVAINIAIVAGLAVYFLPAIIASRRGHQNDIPILVLNLLAGWSALGWIAAFVWSITAVQKPKES